MAKKFHNRISNLKLSGKLNLLIIVTSVVACLIIALIGGWFYSVISNQQRLESAQIETANAAEGMNLNEQSIIERFVTICGTEEFAQECEYQKLHPEDQIRNELNFTNELYDLARENYLISNAFLMSTDHVHVYSQYKNFFSEKVQQLISDEDWKTISRTTYLSSRKSPFSQSTEVIPLVIPIRVAQGPYLQIPTVSGEADILAVFLLDRVKLEHSLNTSNLKQESSTYYLFSLDGRIISISEDANSLTSELKLQMTDLVNTMLETRDASIIKTTSDYYLLGQRLYRDNLILVNYVEREKILDQIARFDHAIVLILAVVLLLVFVLSNFMRREVVLPVMHLVDTVKRIERHDYHPEAAAQTDDEIGHLQNAIDSMYQTILKQMDQIKKEEAEKYRIELKLMTEQINPHFLYNTLEEIKSEISQKQDDTATKMIQYLADYMRISLSGGADEILITSEIRHADAYLRIMNQRFGQRIRFIYRIDEALENRLILKTILQPLIENAVRHGFGVEAVGIMAAEPVIEVLFSETPEHMKIEVADNGIGFQAADLDKLIQNSENMLSPASHVGIPNVYHRLRTHYGKANIHMSFLSIPFYRNSIVIDIDIKREDMQSLRNDLRK